MTTTEDTRRALIIRLFAEHGATLRALLNQHVRQPLEAARLAQEVYVRMLRTPDLGANLEACLFAIANRVAREHALGEPTDA